ncbi:MAG: HAD family phosphatase [Coriobacteriaceae bacterium]|nr:HAD family phosphatase [Coriobacteriaceae bacterium]
MIKLVLTDMDGTVVPFGKMSVSDRTIAAAHKLLDAGIAFGPATGRLSFDLASYFRNDADCYQTGVFANGKMVRYQGETIYSQPMDPKLMNRLIETLRDVDDCFAFICTPDERGNTTFSAVETTRAKILSMVDDTLVSPDIAIIDELPDQPIYTMSILFGDSLGSVEQAAQKMRDIVPEFDYVCPSPHVFDVLPRGLSKADGAVALIDYLGLSLDEVVFFGDADNDVTMLERLTQTFVVSNCSDAARKLGRWIIGDASDDAPAQIMEEIAASGGQLPTIAR